MKTNTSYLYHYNILGLQPGASKKEIQAAFRSLAKLYHADQDSSLYAEMRYKEIRAAYDALRQKAKDRAETGAENHSPTPPTPNTNYGAANKRQRASTGRRTVCGKSWEYTEENHEDSKFDMGDLGWGVKYESRHPPDNRLPFSLENLPDIFRTSFNEVFGVEIFIKVFLMALGLWLTLTWVGWGIVWRTGAISSILIGSLIYRYYFSSHSDFTASLLCSAALSSLCVVITNPVLSIVLSRRRHFGQVIYNVVHNEGGSAFVILFILIFVSLFFLWVRPMNVLKGLED